MRGPDIESSKITCASLPRYFRWRPCRFAPRACPLWPLVRVRRGGGGAGAGGGAGGGDYLVIIYIGITNSV